MKLLDVPWEGFLKPKMESNPKVKMERESFEKEKQNADCVEDGASHGYGKVKVVKAGWVMGFSVGFQWGWVWPVGLWVFRLGSGRR
jgi:hypothetical protein